MSDTKRLLDLLSDGLPHSTKEIQKEVYGDEHLGLCRVGARINELVNMGYVFLDRQGNPIEGKNKRRGWTDSETPSIYWYRIIPPVKAHNASLGAGLVATKQPPEDLFKQTPWGQEVPGIAV